MHDCLQPGTVVVKRLGHRSNPSESYNNNNNNNQNKTGVASSQYIHWLL